jgi:predicted DNA-binding transcriptional regulator AlpA
MLNTNDTPTVPAGLNNRQAAALVGVCEETLKAMCDRDPTFPRPVKMGRRRVWDRASLLAYLRGEAK